MNAAAIARPAARAGTGMARAADRGASRALRLLAHELACAASGGQAPADLVRRRLGPLWEAACEGPPDPAVGFEAMRLALQLARWQSQPPRRVGVPPLAVRLVRISGAPSAWTLEIEARIPADVRCAEAEAWLADAEHLWQVAGVACRVQRVAWGGGTPAQGEPAPYPAWGWGANALLAAGA